jgi:exodeoxyribonuclease I
MGFVFYDTETTGTATSFDQILQFAAIRTDADLNILERFEIRSRLLPFVIPSPYALRVTKMTIDRLHDPDTPSHYDMVRSIIAKMTEWSPAIFLGYNSLKFDEELLRQALYQTLHNPYFTNMNRNCRGDVMNLVQAVSVLVPDCLKLPIGDKGKVVYKLDKLAPANGFDHSNAHDALSDVEATIHLCRLVEGGASDIWNRFVRFTRKDAVLDFLAEYEPFLITEFYGGKAKNTPALRIGVDATVSSYSLCFDLRNDLDTFRNMTDQKLLKRLAASPRPIRKVRANAASIMTPLDEVPAPLLGDFSLQQLFDRAEELHADKALRIRIVEAYEADQTEYPPSEQVEKTMYEGFACNIDTALMMRFHVLPWEQRHTLCDKFQKPALGFLAKRLIYTHNPNFLPSAWRDEIEMHIEVRINSVEPKPEWTTLSKAHSDCTTMLKDASGEDVALVTGYLNYLNLRI